MISRILNFWRIDYSEGYRWYTVGGGREAGDCWWIKLGPVALSRYRWFDGRARLGLSVAGGREIILQGGPLT